MLKDLTKDDWLSILGIPPSRVPQALLLRGTRNLRSNYDRHRALLTDVLDVGAPNGVFEDVMVGSYQGTDIGYASVYGDVMASEVTHAFAVLGTQMVIQTGCCGALRPEIQSGDLVCATSAYCGEGASRYYTPTDWEIDATPELVDYAVHWETGSLTMHTGRLFTTAAMLAESRDDIEEWNRQGFIGVEMETATTYSVAQHFGLRRISVLFAFDNPYQGEHLLLDDLAKHERRVRGEQTMLNLALSMCLQEAEQFGE